VVEPVGVTTPHDAELLGAVEQTDGVETQRSQHAEFGDLVEETQNCDNEGIIVLQLS
jgi:hypothetical protein